MKYFAILCLLFLVGCQNYIPFVYKPDIQQGNLLEADKVDQIEIGMTREQVEYILGGPISHDTFGENRFDYVYYYKAKYADPVHKKLTIYFGKDSKVTRIKR